MNRMSPEAPSGNKLLSLSYSPTLHTLTMHATVSTRWIQCCSSMWCALAPLSHIGFWIYLYTTRRWKKNERMNKNRKCNNVWASAACGHQQNFATIWIETRAQNFQYMMILTGFRAHNVCVCVCVCVCRMNLENNGFCNLQFEVYDIKMENDDGFWMLSMLLVGLQSTDTEWGLTLR